jgi:hypothetical protein
MSCTPTFHPAPHFPFPISHFIFLPLSRPPSLAALYATLHFLVIRLLLSPAITGSCLSDSLTRLNTIILHLPLPLSLPPALFHPFPYFVYSTTVLLPRRRFLLIKISHGKYPESFSVELISSFHQSRKYIFRLQMSSPLFPNMIASVSFISEISNPLRWTTWPHAIKPYPLEETKAIISPRRDELCNYDVGITIMV